ncbi:MAG: DHHA1 domain-containing protein [Phycisphaerae bacterium]
MTKEWIIQPPWQDCKQAAARWRVPPLVAQILHNRGLGIDDNVGDFLAPSLSSLIPPAGLPGAVTAARAIAESIGRGDRIVLYGDYDVDGLTGLAALWHVLRAAGGDLSFYVPHRLEEGYGVNTQAIRSLIDDGARTIITVDCGITALEAAGIAQQAGVRFIVTDHHQAGDALPENALIVHPTIGGARRDSRTSTTTVGGARRDSRTSNHPTVGGGGSDSFTSTNEHLCGAGVAFKLGWAVAQVLSGAEKVSEKYRTLLHDTLAFAALGTIADVVPLVGENRIIARYGLRLLATTPFVGLRVLIESAGLDSGKLDGYDVGFKLAPRLNAAGRMGHARLALDLLTRADETRSREIALYLEEQNRARQAVERRITKQAIEQVERLGIADDAHRAIVLADENWHAGVIGIVAARLVDRYHRPAVVISLEKGKGQGSARSIANFDLFQGLASCADHLLEFGGHAMAAGLKIEPHRIPRFSEAFIEVANNTLTAADLRAKLRIDAEVELAALDFPTTEALLGLGPFGVGNPSPRLATDWVELADEPRCVGKSGDHVQAVFRDAGTGGQAASGTRAVLRAIAFGQADRMEQLKKHRRCRLAFKPIINDFNGRRTVEMQVLDFRFPE